MDGCQGLVLSFRHYVTMMANGMNEKGKWVMLLLTPAILSAFVVIGFFQPAHAETPIAVELEKVDERGVLTSADGGEFCLAGIWVPTVSKDSGHAVDWRSAWRDIVAGGGFVHRNVGPPKWDRYGCALAHVESATGVSLQHALLAAGWAAVDPLSAPDDADVVDAMLALEERARRTRLGIWQEENARPKKADELSDWMGTRQLVEGRSRRVSENKRYVYVNFGADWRTDFTIRLRRKMMDSAGFDAAGLEGRRLRVRGVVQDSRGPLIDVSHLKQIEFLP